MLKHHHVGPIGKGAASPMPLFRSTHGSSQGGHPPYSGPLFRSTHGSGLGGHPPYSGSWSRLQCLKRSMAPPVVPQRCCRMHMYAQPRTAQPGPAPRPPVKRCAVTLTDTSCFVVPGGSCSHSMMLSEDWSQRKRSASGAASHCRRTACTWGVGPAGNHGQQASGLEPLTVIGSPSLQWWTRATKVFWKTTQGARKRGLTGRTRHARCLYLAHTHQHNRHTHLGCTLINTHRHTHTSWLHTTTAQHGACLPSR